MHHDADDSPLLADLTPAQRSAVLHTEGPVLILAAAGSGKTRVITRRVAHLLSMGIPAWQILALTFTNKAAGEMRERVKGLIESGTSGGLDLHGRDPERILRGLTMTTFHALCARLLRRYAELMEGAPHWRIRGDYSIYDTQDQEALMKRVLADLNLGTSNFPPKAMLSRISGAKNQLMDPRRAAQEWGDYVGRVAAKVYEAYEKALHGANAVDFDDLLVLTVRLLRECETARREVQERWRYLMIDEYQDTNHAQFALAGLLCAGEGAAPPNICVVGDPDQSIYGWRGADISNILDFEERFPSAKVIALGENFRSTGPILRAADTVIRKNKRRKHKPLTPVRAGGGLPEVVHCRDEHHEASLVADWLEARRQADPDLQWKDMAVFYRNNALSRVMEDALRARSIPYVIARGTAFYQREEVKDALAYLRVVANPFDDVSLRRIINKPARKIGNSTIELLETLAAGRGISLFEAARLAREVPAMTNAGAAAVERFVSMLDDWTGNGTFFGGSASEDPGQRGMLRGLVERVLRESGLEKHYREKNEGDDAGEGRLDNLAELVSSAYEFELEYDPAGDAAMDAPRRTAKSVGSAAEPDDLAQTIPPLLSMLRGYLESVTLVADADRVDPARGAVTLMTLHAAKGLEFPVVAVIGLEEGILPSIRVIQEHGDVEEERRLFFVGITRAMDHLLITDARYRTFRGLRERTIGSRFLGELPADGIAESDQSDELHGYDEDEAGSSWDRPSSMLGGGRAAAPSRGGAGARASHDSDDDPAVQFPVGCRVSHPQFGEGRVEVVLARGVNARATIAFRDVGRKTLVLQYARLRRIG